MKKPASIYPATVLFLVLGLLSSGQKLIAQASVAYYPWNGVFSVSTNPDKIVWGDARLQTNTLLGSLSTELIPMVNFKRTEMANFYAGAGVRLNFIGALANGDRLMEGYIMSIGTRIVPFKAHRNFRVAFEFQPYVQRSGKSGVMKTNFGLAYVFGKRDAQ